MLEDVPALKARMRVRLVNADFDVSVFRYALMPKVMRIVRQVAFAELSAPCIGVQAASSRRALLAPVERLLALLETAGAARFPALALAERVQVLSGNIAVEPLIECAGVVANHHQAVGF